MLRSRFAPLWALAGVGVTALLAMPACTDTAEPAPEPVAAALVTPAQATLEVAETAQFSVRLEDAAGRVLQREVTWRSSDPSVAAVGTAGLVTAVHAGVTAVTAASEGVVGSATVTVLPPVASLTLTPTAASLLPGETLVLAATASDGNGQPSSRAVSWSTSDAAVAVVDTRGVVAAIAPGTATIAASVGGRTATAVLTVRMPVSAVIVSPATAEVRLGITLPLGVTVLDAAGKQLAAPVVWSTGDPAIATVDATGLLTPVSIGTVAIAATAEGKTGLAAITVVAPANAVSVTPAVLALDVDESAVLSVTVLDRDKNPLSRPASWSSSTPAVATVTPDGLVTAVAPGTAVVTATVEGKSGTAAVTVQVPVAEVAVAATADLEAGDLMTLAAVPQDANGATLDRTVTWSSSDPGVATVDQLGTVRGVSPGVAVIAATAGKHTSWTSLTVLVPVATVTLAPTPTSLSPGGSITLAAVVRDAQGNPISREVTWASSNPSIATVDAGGVLRAVSPGTVTISASVRGKTGSMQFTVLAPVAAIALSPTGGSLKIGETLALKATPKDITGMPLSRTVAWSSLAPAVATVSASGVVTAVGTGTATIVAASEGVSAKATITVAPAVGSIVIGDPGMQPLHVDSTQQLTATVYDGSGGVLNRPVAWGSSDTTIASVDQAGLVTGKGPGTATITATAAGVTGSVSIRVVGHATTAGNNLSFPAVFAEGIGVTGLPVSQDAGLRPTAAEGIAVTGLPFFYPGNVPDYGTYYLQQGASVWQAMWEDGTAGGVQLAEVAWGDNLTHHTWNTHAPIRIEVTLAAFAHAPMTGYRMTALFGTGPTEMQGTDGGTVDTLPVIYSVTPRLTIERIDDSTRVPIHTLFDGAIYEGLGVDGPGAFGAEVNVAGKIIYGFNLTIRDYTLPSGMTKFGWYRISFRLDPVATVGGVAIPRNTALDRLATPSDALTYMPEIDPLQNVSWIDIYILSASGGGGHSGDGGH